MRTIPLAVAGLLTISVSALLPALYAQQTALPPIPQPGDRSPDTLVESREASQQARRDAINRRGGQGKLVAMRSIVRAHFQPVGRRSTGITNAERLDAQNAEQIALFLTMLGYDPSSLQSNGPEAAKIVGSARAIHFGRSTITDEIAVSPNVVVARLKSVVSDAQGDGYASTATLEVTQSIKGSIKVGETLHLRQRSGRTSDGEILVVQDEFQPHMNGEYLIFVSTDMYQFRSRRAVEGPGDYVAAFLLPYQVVNGTAHSIGHGQQSSGFQVASLAQ